MMNSNIVEQIHGLINAIQIRIQLLRRTQVVQELMKRKIMDHSQALVLIAKDLHKHPILAQELDQRQLSTKIAQETFQTAMVQMVLQVLTAAEQLKVL